MKKNFWIKLRGKRYNTWGPVAEILQPTVTNEKPSTGKDEISFKVELDIPEGYFDTPELIAEIILPDPASKLRITQKMKQKLAEEVKKNMGLTINLTLPEKKKGLK